MSTIIAVRSGNWTDNSHVTGPWPGGSTPTTLPGAEDVADCGDYVVTIDGNITAAELRNDGSGHFLITAEKTITCSLNPIGAPRLLYHQASTPLTIIGNINLENASENCRGVDSTSGNIFVTGNVTGGMRGGNTAINKSSGNVTITGTATSGSGADAYAVSNSNGNITLIGELTCGGATVLSAPNGRVTFSGNVVATADSPIIYCNTCTIVGNVDSQGSAAPMIVLTGGSITGNVIGGSAPGVSGLTGELTVVGNLYAGSAAPAVDGGTVILDGEANFSSTFGYVPISGCLKMVNRPANAITVISSTDTPLTLSNDYPAEADVKSGVEYNRGTMTGELVAGGSIGPVSIVIGGGGIRIS